MGMRYRGAANTLFTARSKSRFDESLATPNPWLWCRPLLPSSGCMLQVTPPTRRPMFLSRVVASHYREQVLHSRLRSINTHVQPYVCAHQASCVACRKPRCRWFTLALGWARALRGGVMCVLGSAEKGWFSSSCKGRVTHADSRVPKCSEHNIYRQKSRQMVRLVKI